MGGNHYMQHTGVNWAMSLSGCGIPPVLKLKICLLQLEVQTSLSDWGGRDKIEHRLPAGCRCEMKWQGTCRFLPACADAKGLAISGWEGKKKAKKKRVRCYTWRNTLLHLKLQYLLLWPVLHDICMHSKHLVIIKRTPQSPFKPLEFSSALKCSGTVRLHTSTVVVVVGGGCL